MKTESAVTTAKAIMGDRVLGRPVRIVLGAVSETIAERQRLNRGRWIEQRARLQGASHCLLVGAVVYLADGGGISLAAQIEHHTRKDDSPQLGGLVCVPLDSLVYLCHYENGLVSDERMVPPERALIELKAATEPVFTIPAGSLSPQFAECGESMQVELVLRRGWRNPATLRPITLSLLAARILTPKHAIYAALGACVMAAVLAVSTRITAIWSSVEPLTQPVQALVQGNQQTIAASAPASLRRINQLVHQLSPVASWLGVSDLRADNAALRFEVSADRLPAMTGALPFGFSQDAHNGSRVSWQAPLPVSGPQLHPASTARLWERVNRIRFLPGIRLAGLERHSGVTGAVVVLEIEMRAPLVAAFEDLAAALEGLPATLKAANIGYGAAGTPQSARVLLEIRTVKT